MWIYIEEPLRKPEGAAPQGTALGEPMGAALGEPLGDPLVSALGLTGVVRGAAAPGQIIAWRVAGHLLDGPTHDRLREALSGDLSSLLPSPVPHLLLWSGTLASEPFEADPRTWMGPGWRALAERCDQLAPLLERAGVTLCLQPHARHVLSDIRSCLSFLAARRGQRFALALSPVTMLEAAMLPARAEHLDRIMDALGSAAAMILLSDVKPPHEAGEPPLLCPLGEGVLPIRLLRDLLATKVAPTRPIVLGHERWPAQQHALLGE
jgi:hypothetical protein